MATVKQKRAFVEVVNGSKLTEAMRIAKYATSTTKRTNKLTRTKVWEELMKKELPDGLLAKRHKELLDKREVFKMFNGEGKLIDQPETQAVSRALDMAYKLKGHYPQGDGEGNKTLIINISGESAQRYGFQINPQSENNSIRPA